MKFNYNTQIKRLYTSLQKLNNKLIEDMYHYLERAVTNNNTIYAFGNGGSASIANHFACDFLKGSNYKKKIRYISLSCNNELITAISNDIGYSSIYSFQLERLVKKDDLIIAISSSGNSKNIIKAVQIANRKKAHTIGLTGFDGGKVSQIVDLSINIKSDNYGVIEDSHSFLMHFMSQKLHK